MPFRSPPTLTQAEQRSCKPPPATRATTRSSPSPSAPGSASARSLASTSAACTSTTASRAHGSGYARGCKGRSRRRWLVPDALVAKLARFWRYEQARRERLDPSSPLFCNQGRRRISKRRVQVLFRAWQVVPRSLPSYTPIPRTRRRTIGCAGWSANVRRHRGPHLASRTHASASTGARARECAGKGERV
jgi:hypothetical protein